MSEPGFRALLVKYIGYVRGCEGTYFLDHCQQRHSQQAARLTDEEFAQLERLAEEIDPPIPAEPAGAATLHFLREGLR